MNVLPTLVVEGRGPLRSRRTLCRHTCTVVAVSHPVRGLVDTLQTHAHDRSCQSSSQSKKPTDYALTRWGAGLYLAQGRVSSLKFKVQSFAKADVRSDGGGGGGGGGWGVTPNTALSPLEWFCIETGSDDSPPSPPTLSLSLTTRLILHSDGQQRELAPPPHPPEKNRSLQSNATLSPPEWFSPLRWEAMRATPPPPPPTTTHTHIQDYFIISSENKDIHVDLGPRQPLSGQPLV